jgi:tricarballylate dehydrogenase
MFMPSLYPPIRRQRRGTGREARTADRGARGHRGDFNAATRPGRFDHTELDDCRTEGLDAAEEHWARRIDDGAVLRLSGPAGHHLHLSRHKRRPRGAHAMASGGGAENMYAAGEIMAGNVLGKGYAAGIGMTIGSVFGRIAGEGGGTACTRLIT